MKKENKMKKLNKIWNKAKPILNKEFTVKGKVIKVWYPLAAIVAICIIL